MCKWTVHVALTQGEWCCQSAKVQMGIADCSFALKFYLQQLHLPHMDRYQVVHDALSERVQLIHGISDCRLASCLHLQ